MTMTARLQELRRRHRTLSDEVERAQSHPSTDPTAITEMKKRKLALKEEIARLQTA
ncbi:MAG: YdcH family protein [Paracoccaceae bacterium]